MADNEAPRRTQLAKMTPAERLLRSVRLAVEGMKGTQVPGSGLPPAQDVRLTEALEHLDLARDKIGDVVDDRISANQSSTGASNQQEVGSIASDVPLAQVQDPNFMSERRRGIR